MDNAIDVEFEDYAGTEDKKVGVYAVDFAGNQSEVVEIKNPHYEGAADTESTAEQKPFTPAGQASVLDNATDGDGKEFYTFVTPEENVFYLVIDNQRDSENVYFLNAVTVPGGDAAFDAGGYRRAAGEGPAHLRSEERRVGKECRL